MTAIIARGAVHCQPAWIAAKDILIFTMSNVNQVDNLLICSAA